MNKAYIKSTVEVFPREPWSVWLKQLFSGGFLLTSYSQNALRFNYFLPLCNLSFLARLIWGWVDSAGTLVFFSSWFYCTCWGLVTTWFKSLTLRSNTCEQFNRGIRSFRSHSNIRKWLVVLVKDLDGVEDETKGQRSSGRRKCKQTSSDEEEPSSR